MADRAPDAAFQVQALQELALLSAEEERPEAALEAWRRLLGVAPPGHPSIANARLALLGRCGAWGPRLDEALGICEQAVATTTGLDHAAGPGRLRRKAASGPVTWRRPREARSGWPAVPVLPADRRRRLAEAARCTSPWTSPAAAARLARGCLP